MRARRLLVHFSRYGDYHHARLRAAKEILEGDEVMGLETAGDDSTYAWKRHTGERVDLFTAFPDSVYEEIPPKRLTKGLWSQLDSLQADVVAIAGWGFADARACLSWCKRNRRKAILMSETRRVDGKRVWWKESLKKRIVSKFDAALVGGASHRDYLVGLGMKAEQIALGYDVVDNTYFREGGKKLWEQGEVQENWQPFFLASNRFIERKNLDRLLEAYQSYSHHALSAGAVLWHLCLLGDGALKEALQAQCVRSGLSVAECSPWEVDFDPEAHHGPVVYFPGFRQIEELPKFYANASCFIHPALEEPWGLVINEAMASGLPVLSSRNVGAAEELVRDGENGWRFDAASAEEMARGMRKMANLSPENRAAMGEASSRLIEEKCPTEAFGKGLASALERVRDV